MAEEFQTDKFYGRRLHMYSVWVETAGGRTLIGKARALDVQVNGFTRWAINPWGSVEDRGRYDSFEAAATRLLEIFETTHGVPNAPKS